MNLIENIRDQIWGNGLITLLLGTGLAYTLRLGFIQLRTVNLIRCEKSNNSGISQLKTVCMSLGTAMGTGNIVGVSAAILEGGAGALFWMWVSAFLGMALVFAENYLSVEYSNDTVKGAAAYIKNGLGSRKLAAVFSVFCVLAAFGMGGMVQVNSASESLLSCININRYWLAAAAFAVILLIVSGGAKRIGAAAAYLLPAASLLYSIVCLAVVFLHRNRLPMVIPDIFCGAFGLKQAAGGICGYAVSVGIRRGIFSNEAGLGSSPALHSAAGSSSPVSQGAWSMAEVLIDMFCCTLTALALLCAGSDISAAFSSILGNNADLFLAAEMNVFALCTVIGWYYCGETSFSYLTGNRYKRLFSVIFAAAASTGAIAAMNTVWTISDIFNGLMAIPNLLALVLLMRKIPKKSLSSDKDSE